MMEIASQLRVHESWVRAIISACARDQAGAAMSLAADIEHSRGRGGHSGSEGRLFDEWNAIDIWPNR